MVWVPRIMAGLFLLPAPLLLGLVLSLFITVVWLPVGLLWVSFGLCFPKLIPRHSRPMHILLPILALHRVTGGVHFFRFVFFLGGIPLLSLVVFILQLVWLPLAFIPFLYLRYKRPTRSWSFLFLPTNIIGTAFFDRDDE